MSLELCLNEAILCMLNKLEFESYNPVSIHLEVFNYTVRITIQSRHNIIRQNVARNQAILCPLLGHPFNVFCCRYEL